jgi:hypothetical protein
MMMLKESSLRRGLFPTTGFQIITEPSSPEDSPDSLERNQFLAGGSLTAGRPVASAFWAVSRETGAYA